MNRLIASKIVFLFANFCFQQMHLSAQFFDVPSKTIDNASFIITYELSYKEDSNNLNIIRKEEMLLLIGENTGFFAGKNFYLFIQQGRQAEREGRLDFFLDEYKSKNKMGRFTYSIYKNYPSGKITFTNKVIPTFLLYEEDLSSFQWELKNGEEKVAGYNTRQAGIHYGGRQWTAWYTTEVPINEGPYKFRGLPGLIVKVADSRGHYEFNLISIERLSEKLPIEFEEHDYVKTTREKYLKSEENLRRDIISRAREAGAGNQSQQIAVRNMERRNNPIEIK